MIWDLHGLAIEAEWDDDRVGERWASSFASRPTVDTFADLSLSLCLAHEPPPPPAGQPNFRQAELIEYYLNGDQVTAHLPRYGQLRLNLATGQTEGRIVTAVLDTYGVFEDLVAIGLSPHLRRRGMYLIHAFAAVDPHPTPSEAASQHGGEASPNAETSDGGGASGGAVLIVGPIGSGKTTTGMALLDAGWKLLSNDSPVISATTEILSYPGLLSAYADSLAKFEATRPLASSVDPHKKLTFAAESIWPGVWAEWAGPRAIVFPRIAPRPDHTLERLPEPEALRLILPHAIEQWDKEMMPAHFALLNELVRSTPAYRLRLGTEAASLPGVIGAAIALDH